MKLPRWLVIAMLTTSVLAVVAAAGWWWVTWPERTAREFCELIRDGRVADAFRMIEPSPGREELSDAMKEDESDKDWRSKYRTAQLEFDGSRGPADLFLGHRRFRLMISYREELENLQFEVERGRVIVRPLKIYISFN